jgi:cyclophilin family peptidyl-prolyl cis-trans isomerase
MHAAALVLVLAQATGPAGPPPSAPAEAAPTGPFVALDVTQGRAPLGTIVMALDKEKAPVSVENFLAYLRAGHYDGTIFHRVRPNFMAQGGGYTPEMEEKPQRPPIENEARNGLRNSRGSVAMARLSAPNSATSQFFINVRDNHMLDFGIGGAGYAVFGRVVEGMEIVDKIVAVPTTSRGQHQDVPQVPIIIRKARELPSWAPKAAPAQPVAPATASQPAPARPVAPKAASHPAPRP